MNVELYCVELIVTKSGEEAVHQVSLPKHVKTLCIVDETNEFVLIDEQNNTFSDIFYPQNEFVQIQFKPSRLGFYQVRVKGYDDNLQEVLVITLRGNYFHERSRILCGLLVIVGLLACLVFIIKGYSNYWAENKGISTPIQSKILHVGSTEKYIDRDVLLNRIQRYYVSKIDDETFSNKPIKELYRLLKSGKIDCIITSLANVDTTTIYWSDVYAIDNNGGLGLRMGVLKTTKNLQLIRQFNQ